MRLSSRRGGAWALAALAVGGGAFALGLITAPQQSSPSAPRADEPSGVDLPKLGGVASLPALHQETAAVKVESQTEGGETPQAIEPPAPVEPVPAEPVEPVEPAEPPPEGEEEEIVPEGR